MIKKINLNIAKFTIIIAAIIISTSFILSYFFVLEQASMLKSFLRTKNIILIKFLATTSELGFSSSGPNTEFLHFLVQDNLKEEDIIYSVIYDENGIPITSETIANESVSRYISSTSLEPQTFKNLVRNEPIEYISQILKFGKVMDIVAPIIIYDYNTTIQKVKSDRESVIGAVRIGVSLNSIENQTRKLVTKLIKITLIILLIEFIGIILSVFIAHVLFRKNTSK